MEINKLLKYLSCPNCHSDLELINSKKLYCCNCSETYQIINGIPILIYEKSLDAQEKKQTMWFDRHYSHFQNKYHLENWRLSMINRIFNQKFSKEIKTYLDIGCGATGYTTIQAAKQNNWLSFGVDISLEAMVKAKHFSKNQKVENNTGFIVASAQKLPFKKNIFDYVSVISILEHLDRDYEAIDQVNRILKNKKYLYICVPNAYQKILPIIWPFYYYNDVKIGHKRHYSINSLNHLTEKYFKLKKHFYNGHLIKFFQLFLSKINKINNNLWWNIEKKDINNNPTGVQLNAIYQKK